MLHILAFLVFGVVVLQTDRSDCPCGKSLTRKLRKAGDGEGTTISLYTRDGMVQAKHLDFIGVVLQPEFLYHDGVLI